MSEIQSDKPCMAIAVRQKEPRFAYLESLMLRIAVKNNDYAMFHKLVFQAIVRSMCIPAHILNSGSHGSYQSRSLG